MQYKKKMYHLNNTDDDDEIIDSYYNSIIYDSETIGYSKYDLVLYEPFNNKINGYETDINNDKLMTHMRFNKLDINVFREQKIHMLKFISYILKKKITHSHIRNYKQILQRLNPEIAECFYDPLGFCFCVLKTFWIKIIQRKWKKIMLQRREIIKQRCHIFALKTREITGKWPNKLIHMPNICGMLCDLV